MLPAMNEDGEEDSDSEGNMYLSETEEEKPKEEEEEKEEEVKKEGEAQSNKKKPSRISRLEELNRIKAKVQAKKAKIKVAAEAKKPPQKVSSSLEVDKTTRAKLQTNFLKAVKKLENVNPISGDLSIPEETKEAVVAGSDTTADTTNDSNPTPPPKPSREATDCTKRKADALFKLKAPTFFRDRMQDQKQFLDAFNNSVEEEDLQETWNAALAEKKAKQTIHLGPTHDPSTGIQECEAKLDRDRNEMEIPTENVKYQLKQESAEQLLQEETRKNEELQLKLQPLQDTISSMLIAKTSEMRQQLSVGNLNNSSRYLSTPSKLRPKISSLYCYTPNFERSMILKMGDNNHELADADEDDDNETVQSGYMSISPMSGTAQGELFQLRSTLQQTCPSQ
ncbi:unnamed protein product [Cylindrotheca closterium]|uniref:Uncharacterized protein n=1 Tax=Cylindrotheca closterium TaxID=2856 RepID=A0AAD2CSY9_9STRA|nr:unnamed protein product [Cylindrotheca closterium]